MHPRSGKAVLLVAIGPQSSRKRRGRTRATCSRSSAGTRKNSLPRGGSGRPVHRRRCIRRWTGCSLPSYLRAYQVWTNRRSGNSPSKALARIPEGALFGENASYYENGPAVLDDYVSSSEALVAAYEVTANKPISPGPTGLMPPAWKVFRQGRRLLRYPSATSSGRGSSGSRTFRTPRQTGAARPWPCSSSILTGAEAFRSAGEGVARIFISSAREMGIHGGSYFCALDASFTLSAAVDADPERARRCRPRA